MISDDKIYNELEFLNENDFQIPFYFNNIFVMGENGNLIQIPDQVAYINLSKKSSDAENFNPSDLLLYPNPIVDQLTVHLNGKSSMLSLSLYSIDGKLIQHIEHPDSKHQIMNLQELKNGLYSIKVESNFGSISRKIEILR